MSGYYPMYVPENNEFYICWANDYDVDEFQGTNLTSTSFDTMEQVVQYVQERIDRLPVDVQRAFTFYRETNENTLKCILDD